MSSEAVNEAANEVENAPGQPRVELNRLGYLLKHAQQRLTEMTAAALEPYGVNGRELGVLVVLDQMGATSQQDVARRLGIDRTTMVALIDALEAKSVVVRRPSAEDRRRNVVEFTESGHGLFRQALQASDEAERRFVSPLEDAAAELLREQLRAVIEERD
ncbi:MAG TPA: MarR family transcriptional regulator [Actinospica sp.]|jgi:DNA-binding MarR family transcriptional regulator|nr:MarR family transcriptional regulator [Actinospica sp.]